MKFSRLLTTMVLSLLSTLFCGCAQNSKNPHGTPTATQPSVGGTVSTEPVLISGSIYTGTNAPNNLLAAPKSSIFNLFDVTGTNFVAQYIKTTPNGSNGWVLATNQVNVTMPAAVTTNMLNTAATTYIDPNGSANGQRDSIYKPYALLSQAVKTAQPGDTIVINGGNYLDSGDPVVGAITLTNNLSIVATVGVNYTLSNNVAAQIYYIIVAGGDSISGGTWNGAYVVGQIPTMAVFGGINGLTNILFENVNINSSFAGFRCQPFAVSSSKFVNCTVKGSYAGWVSVSTSGGMNFELWDCTFIGTNPPPAKLNDMRTGFRLKGANSGTMELHNCKVVVNDVGTAQAAYGIGSVFGLVTNGFKIFGMSIDTSGCTNTASADIGVNAPAGAMLFANVYRSDGLTLTFTNLAATTNKPWRTAPEP